MRGLPIRRPENVGRFAVLLVTLITTLLAAPFFEQNLAGISRFRLLTIGILLAGVYALSRGPRVLAAALALALPALAIEASVGLRPGSGLVVAGFVLSILFLGLLTTVILHRILDEERVTLDTILGGICIYLLIGFGWMLAYSLLEYLSPGSFLVDGQPLQRPPDANEYRHEELIYFSFVTLTTVGYGDVLAKTSPARALAAAEAVTGSLYLAVFIARLVGLHMVHQRRDLDL